MLDTILSPQIGLIFFQTVIIIIAAFILKRFAWKSVLAFIKKEEELQEKARLEAKKAEKKVNELQKMSETIIASAHKRSEKIVEEALSDRDTLLEKGKKEIEEERISMVKKAKEMIAKTEEETLKKAKKEVAKLAVRVVRKILAIELQQKNMQKRVMEQLISKAEQDQSIQLNG